MRRILLLPAIVLLLLIFGCDQREMMEKLAPQEKVEEAKNYIAQLREGKYDQIDKDMDPSIKTGDMKKVFDSMAAIIPPGEPVSVKIVGAHINNMFGNGSATQDTNITFEYQFPEKWLLINVVTRKIGDKQTIMGFRVQPIGDSLENTNRFSLAGKTPLHYAMLALASLIPLFIVGTLVLCAMTKMEKRKWLWIIFILCGVGQFAMNWTTGETLFNPIYFSLLGAGVFSFPYGPWTVSISLPLGAIIFLIRRKRLSKPAQLEAIDKAA
jgi:hypothetical protein